MSTDLELLKDLTKIRLPKITIQSSIVIQEENKDQNDSRSECSTPTSEENKIPAVLSCPPAPRKPRKTAAVSCKRKLSELQFFEIVHRDEVDAFFKSAAAGFDDDNSIMSKRRCPCTWNFKIRLIFTYNFTSFFVCIEFGSYTKICH